jgi:rare lipoprotein A
LRGAIAAAIRARPATSAALAGSALVAVALALVITACSRSDNTNLSPRIVEYGEPVPKGGGRYKVGEPYKVNGRWYRPRENPNYDKVGIASWYGRLFHGRHTANGEIYDMDALTAAHPTLPMPSYAQVTNLENGRTIIVRVNDRGPYAHNRVIDLSRRSAQALGIYRKGTGKVRVRYAGRAPLNGDDSYEWRVLASQPWSRVAGKKGRTSRDVADARSKGKKKDRAAPLPRPMTVAAAMPDAAKEDERKAPPNREGDAPETAAPRECAGSAQAGALVFFPAAAFRDNVNAGSVRLRL